MTKKPTPVMTADEVNALFGRVFPQLNKDRVDYLVTEVFPGGCTIRLNAIYEHLRPGDTQGTAPAQPPGRRTDRCGPRSSTVDAMAFQDSSGRAGSRLGDTLSCAARGRMGRDGSRSTRSQPIRRRRGSLKSDTVLLFSRWSDRGGRAVCLEVSSTIPGSQRYSCRSACQGLIDAARRAGK